MNIWDIMDCVDCEQRVCIPARVGDDPDRCHPAEERCRQNAPDSGPCRRMLGALEDLLRDGQLATARGYFCALEGLQERQRDDDWIKGHDFSSAPYWWVPDGCYSRADDRPRPYQDILAIFNGWFQ